MMRLRLRSLALVTLTAVVAPALAVMAQEGTEQNFVQKASATDLAEINLGRVAAKRAGSAAVKEFGEKMIADHTKASKELLMIANKLGLRPAATMDAKHEALLEKLSQVKDEEFDRAYVTHMVHGHEMAVALYQQEATSGKNADLKAFAAKTLPVVQEHLKMAKALAAKSGAAKER